MKRFHVNVRVSNLERSVQFYRTLFGVEPTTHKDGYAKWMLDDPRVNFSLNQSQFSRGLNHVGLQVDSLEELKLIQDRLSVAGESTRDESNAHCCYARSTKTWVRDPDRVPWENFLTHEQDADYGVDQMSSSVASEPKRQCCDSIPAEGCCA